MLYDNPNKTQDTNAHYNKQSIEIKKQLRIKIR